MKISSLYNYVQDTERSPHGEYIWYLAGIDWNIRGIVFKVRTGTGGTFNDNWSQEIIEPDDTFYRYVLAGVVAMKVSQ